MRNEVEKGQLGSLTRSFYGYYLESYIQNNTSMNIVAIDKNNNRINIPPITPNKIGRDQVVIWQRSSTNPTRTDAGEILPIPGISITIPLRDLAKEGGIYIDEIDMVLCTEDMSIVSSHPRSSISFSEAVDQIKAEALKIVDAAPTFKIFANDPEGRYNKLYTTFGDVLVEIDVSNMYGEAELLIEFFYKGKRDSYSISLDELFEGENDIIELNDIPINFITTNKAKAVRYGSDYKRIPQAEVDEILKKRDAISAKQIETIRKSVEAELDAKSSEIKRLKESLKLMTHEKDQANAKLSELTVAINTSNVLKEKDVKSQELINKSQISENSVNISDNDVKTSQAKRESAETESKYKLWHLIAAASIPVAGVLLIKLLERTTTKQALATTTHQDTAMTIMKFL